MNAIISAARSECIGGTIYLVGKSAKTGEYLDEPRPCAMCTRMIINAGLSKVIIRRTKTAYDVIDVQEWIERDDSVANPAKP